MTGFVDVLAYSLPLFLVLLAASWGMHKYLKLEKMRARERQKLENSGSILKVRLQAYERLVLFLERMSPQQLVVRNSSQGLSAIELHRTLMENIRLEYEHNLVQQIYISVDVWAQIEQARMWVLKQVNDAARNLEENADGNLLAIAIIEQEMNSPKNYIQIALLALKKEVGQLF